MHVLEGRNRLVQFSGGETVVPHEATKSMFGGNIPHFKSGTSSWWEGLADWAKDKWDSLKNFIKHPMRAVGGLMDKAVNSMLGGKSDLVTKLALPMGHGFVSGIIDPITKLFKDLQGKHEESGGSSGPNAKPSGSHVNWLKQAGINGNFDKWNFIINHESGWNPTAKNPSSDAYGIGQALPPSKMAPFGSDYMTNPITQLKWMKSYVNERYGGIGGAYDFWRSHNWYGNGGRATQPSIFGEVPGEPEWAINPRRASADSLIQGAINERAEVAPNSSTAKAARLIDMAKSGLASSKNVFNVGQSTNTNVQGAASTGNVDLSGDTTIVVKLDSNEIARETYPKIKLLEDHDIQLSALRMGGTL